MSLLFFYFVLPFCFLFLYLVLVVSFCFCLFLSSCSSVFCFLLVVLFWIIISDLAQRCTPCPWFCVASCVLVVVFCCCCFRILLFFDFWKPIKNISEKKHRNSKNSKNEKCRKTDILTRTVSAGVLTNSVFFAFLCFFQFCILGWKTLWKYGFQQKNKMKKKNNKQQNSKAKNRSKIKLKIGPSMLRNKIGPVFNFKRCVFFVVCFCLFFKNPLLSAGRMIFSKINKQNKNGPVFNFKKGKHWTSF